MLVFEGAPSNTIGGTAAGAGNVISGNRDHGVEIDDTGTTNTLVQGNIIGLNPAGTVKIENGATGVQITNGAQSNTIGGTTAAARNIISGNHAQGITILGAGTNLNLVQGNYIGVNVNGSRPRSGTVQLGSVFSWERSRTRLVVQLPVRATSFPGIFFKASPSAIRGRIRIWFKEITLG